MKNSVSSLREMIAEREGELSFTFHGVSLQIASQFNSIL